MDPIIKYVNLNPSVDKISSFVNNKSFKAYGITIGKFVSTSDSSGVTNLERIYSRYSASDFNNDTSYLDKTKADVSKMKALAKDAIDSFTPEYDILKLGTEILLLSSYIHMNMNNPVGSSVRVYNSEPFMVRTMSDLLKDDGYKDIRALHNTSFGLYDRNPKATVWLWCKSLGTGSHLSGGMFDITPFLSGIEMSKQKVGASFTISLAYVYSKFKELAGSTVYDSVMNSVSSSGSRRRNHSHFHSMVSKNDMIFIRMSALKMEDTPVGKLSKSDLVGKVFDIIGLVESVSDGYGSGTDNVSVSITGGDLTKLLAEDGSSIYQNRYISAGKTSEEIELGDGIFRMWGKHSSLFQLQDNPIGTQLSFIIDYMTRSKICDDLFDGNPDARKYKYDIGEGSTAVNTAVNGVWKIVNVGVDKSVSEYTSFNSRIGNDYSPILTQLQQICQEPFVELYTDTYRDKFYIMARRPIFDKASVKSWARNPSIIVIKESDIITDNLVYDNTAYSWYKVNIKLLSAAFDASFRWLIPVKYFQEYADIFGDKPLVAEDPYINHEMSVSNDKKASIFGRRMIEAGLKDFRYMIECNMYLPFTRKGSITVNGRREIKRGIWVYSDSSNEIMYIDAVSHSQQYRQNGNVDWTTTLNVSRAMIKEDVDRYFGVIDMPIGDLTSDSNFEKHITDTLLNWNVNKSNFEYLLKRSQYGKQ